MYHYDRDLNTGFTLVELLVAVAILAIGIVAVMRAFLGAVTGLESLNNRFAVLHYLSPQAASLELASRYDPAADIQDKDIAFDLRGRDAVFKIRASAWGDASLPDALDQVSMSAIWQESGIVKNESIVLLVPVKK